MNAKVIDKIDIVDNPHDGGPLGAIQEKLNELIDAHNNHIHISLDTHYNTTYPRYEE